MRGVQKEKIETFKKSLFLVDTGYTHRLELNLQLSVHWTSSDINLAVNVQRKKVPEVMGVVNQILFRDGAGFYTLHGVQIFPRSFSCENFIRID